MANEEFFRTKDKYKKELLALPGVHAVAVGLKERAGKLTNELAIIVYTENKLELAKVNPDEVIPPLLDGIPTDVQEGPMFKRFATDPAPLAQAVRPVAGGLKITVGDGFGTLGFMALLPDRTTVVGVSNQHVLEPKGQTVFQPDNAKHNDIGATEKVVLSETLDGGYTRLTTTGVPAIYRWIPLHSQYELQGVEGVWVVESNRLPYPVWKTGARTGTTEGQIVALGRDGVSHEGWEYEDQMVIRAAPNSIFSNEGDSGSAIVSSFFVRVVGLLWGGDGLVNGSSGASPILNVLDQLGILIALATPEQLQEPVVVPPGEELLARLKSDQGRKISSFLAEYGPIVRDLIDSDRRIGVTWARNHGHEICNAIIENMAMKSTPLPAEMMGAPTLPALEEFGAVLIERGSPALGAAVEAIRADVEWLIGRSYSEAAGESEVRDCEVGTDSQ